MQDSVEKLQKIELDIFREVISVCEKLHLKYFLLGGTLLGAVRHQGFIPWDDDIDIGMMREDYEVFLAKAQELLPKHLFLQTNQTDNWPANFAKIRNSNTTFVETSVGKREMNHGVYIDIFPLDFYPTCKIKQMFFGFKNKIYVEKISSIFTGGTSLHGWRKGLVNCVASLICPTVEIALKKRERLFKKQKQSLLVANHCGAWGKKEIVPVEWYGDGCELSFEGLRVRAPIHYEKWLTQVYGDYMQLPPEEKRVTHHYTDVIDFDKSYTVYQKRRNQS